MRKYDHLERWGHTEVDGIEVGECLIFPKIDGTNARVWLHEPGRLGFGSRNRELSSLDDDNQGFREWGEANAGPLLASLDAMGGRKILYGEWLVPHTIRTYRPDAWRRFYVFDVWDADAERYLHFDAYSSILDNAGVDVVGPLATIRNPTAEQVYSMLEANSYLMKDGAGAGEGLVIKNYDWTNRFGRQPWAKVVRTGFKENNKKLFGAPKMGEAFQVEVAIAEEFCTPSLVAKERAKIEADLPDEPGASRRLIPQLLGTVFYCVVQEELWLAIKKHKSPTIDFRKLRKHVEGQVKVHARDLFA